MCEVLHIPDTVLVGYVVGGACCLISWNMCARRLSSNINDSKQLEAVSCEHKRVRKPLEGPLDFLLSENLVSFGARFYYPFHFLPAALRGFVHGMFGSHEQRVPY